MALPIWNENVALDEAVLNIPGMVAYGERRYLFTHMRDIYTGQGEAVELGSFLGSSTGATLAGMALNPRARAKMLHVYDLFTWLSVNIDIYKTLVKRSDVDFREGDSFEPLFWDNIRPWSAYAKTYPGDIMAANWNGQPIEYLFVDILKSPEITHHVVRQFFPALIPGVSYMIHQDFKHWYTSWIHLLTYRLREYFEPVCSIVHSGSVVFRCIAPISVEVCEHACAFDDYSINEINASFEYSLSLIANEAAVFQNEIKGAWLTHYLHQIQKIGTNNLSEGLTSPNVRQQAMQLFGDDSERLQADYARLTDDYAQLQASRSQLEQEWFGLKFNPQFMSKQISWGRLFSALVYKLRK